MSDVEDESTYSGKQLANSEKHNQMINLSDKK